MASSTGCGGRKTVFGKKRWVFLPGNLLWLDWQRKNLVSKKQGHWQKRKPSSLPSLQALHKPSPIFLNFGVKKRK
jgi:hypothetical protein